MTTLHQTLEAYLALRQVMGFKVRDARFLLRRFVDFLEQQGATTITQELALRWATEPRTVQPAEWSRRLSVIRGFARYCSATDPRTQIPATGLLPYTPRRASPYLYSETEIAQLLQAASQLPSPTGLRAQTYVTAFGLLAVTGMRVGELAALDDQDVDLTRGQLTIRSGKFGKSRLLPLHSTTVEALRHYVSGAGSPLSDPPDVQFPDFRTRCATDLLGCPSHFRDTLAPDRPAGSGRQSWTPVA